MSKDNVTRRISIFVNGKEVENSLKGVEGAMSQVRNRMRLLNTDSETYDKDSKELAKTMTDLRERQAQYRDELGLTNQTMKQSGETAGGLRGSLSGIWDSLVSGDLQGAKEGIYELRSELGGLVKSSLAFIATPIGAAIAGLAGLAAGAKALFDYNQGLTELNNKLSSLGVAADEISKVRSAIEATAETYNKDFNEIAEKANSLAKTYGISMAEANEIIAKGLADGGQYNTEFLDSLGEYDEFFAKAGYSAEQFANIINTGYDLGIYSDKLPDALKEADLSLKEQTKATRDALVNAFGASFSDDILARVSSGTITTSQALNEISKKANESGLSQQQAAQLTADIFKGAGEDAGGAIKIFETLGEASKKTLGEAGGSYEELRKSSERLKLAQSELFEIKGFSDVWNRIKTAATDSLSSILEWISDVKNDIQPLIDFVGVVFANAWEYLQMTVGIAFDYIGGVLKFFSNTISGVFQFIKKIFTGDFSGAINVLKQTFLNLGNVVENTFGRIKNKVIDALKGIVENISPFLEAVGLDVDKIQKKLDSFKNKEVEIQTKIKEEEKNKKIIAEEKKIAAEKEALLKEELRKQAEIKEEAAKKESEKRKQEAEKAQKAREDAAAKKKADEEKAAKEEYDRAKALADAKANLAKAQLNQYIAGVRENLIKEKELTPEILALNEDRLDTIKNAQIEFNNNELARKIADLEAKQQLEKSSIEVLNLEKGALQLEYEEKNKQLQLDFQAQTDAEKKLYEEQQKALKAEQLLLDNELALQEAATKEEADAIKRQQDYDKRILELKSFKDKGKITEEEYSRFVIALDAKEKEIKRQVELQSTQNKLQELSKLASATTAIFGQNKASASAQALINGGLAVTEILSTKSVLPEPAASISRAFQIAGAVATTARSIAQINSAKAPTPAKFFYGGNTGTKASLGYDEFGPVTGYVHKNEYVIPEVMTQDPVFADTIGWLEAKRKQKLRGYVDGGETTPGTIPSSVQSAENNQMNSLLVALLNRLDNPIPPNLVVGYKDVKAIDDMNNEIKTSTNNAIINE